MNLDQTLAVDIESTAMQTISVGPDFESLLAYDPHRTPFELRVLRYCESLDDSIDRISKQLSLICLVDHPSIREITQPLSDSSPYTFGLTLTPATHPIEDRLDRVLASLEPSERLQLAAQLIDAIGTAHQVGLYHGSFSLESVLVGREETGVRALIDFSAVKFDRFMSGEGLGTEQDLADLRATLKQVLLPQEASIDVLSSIPSVSGRVRAQFRRWLSDDESLPPTIGQWQSLIPLANVSSTVSLDQTGVIEFHAPSDDESTSVLNQELPSLPKATDTDPEQIGRFRIEERIGQGGMGVVYRAIDLSNQQTVALKVLSLKGNNVTQSIRRFRKEARLLADAGNEHVTRLIDVGEDHGTHYLAMEYIEGIDLKQWLVGRGPLPEHDALQIAADLARALLEAHSREVVHRDIKPENILLQFRKNASHSESPPDARPISDFVIKLSDFGIARHVIQSESMEVTQAGSILGTPKYMSPEQCKSAEEIGPSADIYSIGITLYQLLTGRVPFESEDFIKLAAMHCFDAPPPIQKQVAEISDMTARILDRALAKSPNDRYGDASQILADLMKTIHGDASAIANHPRTPDYHSKSLWQKTASWDLESNPVELWPLVSNTERLNEAIGLPAVNYRTEHDPKLGVRKFGSFKISGVRVSWEEHPFEWIEGQRMGILREFDSGPFKWFMSVVTLDPKPGGGTRLSHQVRIEPRNLVGRVITTVEADWKGFRNLKRVYQRMDDAIQTRIADPGNWSNDPFREIKQPSISIHRRIDRRIDNMVRRGADSKAADGIRKVLLHWSAQELAGLRPLNLADRLRTSSTAMLDACLLAATEGLLCLRWHILCPACRVTAASADLLSDIDAHTHCEACDFDFKSNLGDAIELVFRAHPEIRTVNEGQYCIGGPEHSPHVVAQVRLDPQECMDLEVRLAPGDYLLRGPRLLQNSRIRIESKAAPSTVDQALSMLGGSHIHKLRSGNQTITLLNDLDTLHVVRIERTIPRQDVVTATRATANSLFRKLFPDQTFSTETPIESESLGFLATAIANIDELYQLLGDTSAYALIMEHQNQIEDIVKASGGTIVKTIGERVLAAFPRREQAVEAAISIRQSCVECLKDEIQLGIGVHCGQTLVTTQNNQLDYFGSTVRAVTKLPELAGADTLISESVYADPEVQSHYLSEQTIVESINLPGSPNVRCKRIKTKCESQA